jgi:hypothetical protein
MTDGVTINGVFVAFDDDKPRERMSSEAVKPRVEKRMARIDALTPEQRLVVHEYGWNLVDAFLQHGVKSPRAMRALINAVTHNCINRADRADD